MSILKKVFRLGCVPEDNKSNFTVAYEPPKVETLVTKKPQIFSSTLIHDPEDEATPVDNFPTKEKLLTHAENFVNQKIQKLPFSEKELRTMYSILDKCMNERVAMHIWSVSKAPRRSRKILEDVLKNNYMDMLKNPEWKIQWSNYKDLADHPYFPKFFKCQLKSDFIYRNNSHETFMKMKHFLNYLLFHSKAQGSGTFYSMLQSMKENFNEFMVRDLLVLYYHRNTNFGTESMEDYLMAKYQFKGYQNLPRNFNMSYFTDENEEDVKSHPFYIEYFLAKTELEKKFEFTPDPFYSCYKQMAEYWIDFRLNVRNGHNKLPEIVREMYTMMETNLSSSRAYELFLISQYRMDLKKVQRMEAYLSEKYRNHISKTDLDAVTAEYEKGTDDSSFFATRHPHLHALIVTSNTENPVYTQEMIDTVMKMLIEKKKLILARTGNGSLSNRQKHHGKLLDFFYNRPNEEKVRELHAMQVHGVEDWEDVFYEKYKFMIKALENFPIVKKFSI